MSAAAITELTAVARSPSLATFFDNLDSFAEAPEGVAKLRAFVLDLAVRGKLVEQDENDEPASELLERIEAEREKLIADGEFRRPRKEAPLSEDDLPFHLPRGWGWVKLGRIMKKMGAGSTPLGGKRVYVDDGVMFLRSQNVWNDGLRLDDVARITPNIHDDMSGTQIESGDVLLNITGASIGRCALVPDSFDQGNVSQHVAILRLIDKSLRQFLHLCVVSPFFQETIMRVQVGVSREGLSMTRLKEFPFPVPPLSEQRRIVSKVDGLMSLCDELESRSQERVRLRERASRCCLDRLVNAPREPVGGRGSCRAATGKASSIPIGSAGASPSQESVASAWQRLSDHFEVLYDTPETLAHLRQSILQLAVRGKLVPQDPNDEPADELLANIDETRAELVATKQLKKSKPFAAIDESATPFAIPDSWRWVRIGQTARLVEYGTSQKASENGNGVPVLRMNNIQDGCVILDRLKYVPETLDELPDLYLKTYDLLFNRTNSYELVGKTGIFKGPSDQFTFASYLIRLRPFDGVCPEYVNLAMNAAYYRTTQIEPELTQQCGQANFNGTKMKNSLMPLPPSAEQKRIVAKVDQLLSQCDELSARLRERQSATHGLLTATIHRLLCETQGRQ